MSDPELLVTSADGVVTVVFNRPRRHNAFTKAMYTELRELCVDLQQRPEIRVLVLRGAGGRAFAAGNEISDFLEADAVAYEEWIRELLALLFQVPQVTVAAIDGVCVGGGLAVATHCDIRIATPESRFGYPIAKTLGNALAAPVVHRCAAVFGESLTRTMLLTGRLVGAERAFSVGALTELTEDLNGSIDELVDEIVGASAITQRATKRQLNARAVEQEAAPDFDEELLRSVYTGDDFAEGVRAFLAKEKPSFTDSRVG
ncbi:enoyl-CoA hydratase-related protein [Nocardioides houyundeii]|uniref:enoyl-CoA hydratase-related protein n=1 Tax=Nocardioides houyundeii TaxID=2045452 RepID=UPI000C776115|nr:enoyl-CoA hydratase-related protein [Nocardioides houyundeii]